MKKELHPIAEILLSDLEKREELNASYFYDAKHPAIKLAQELGISDEDIELAFGIKIKSEDKNGS